jgi:hypothetical protein
MVLVTCWLSGSASAFASVACPLRRSLLCFWVCAPCRAARHRRPSRLTCFLSIAFRRPAPTPHTHQLERKAPPMCMCRIRIRSLECSTRSLAGGHRCTQTASSIATPLRRSCATSGIARMSAAHIGSQARMDAAHIRSQEAIGAPTQPLNQPGQI